MHVVLGTQNIVDSLDQFIVGLGLLMGFVGNQKNIEQNQKKNDILLHQKPRYDISYNSKHVIELWIE